jgi:hypothetical protein
MTNTSGKMLSRNSEKKENRACWHTSITIIVLSLFSKVHSYLYYFDLIGYTTTTGIVLKYNIFNIFSFTVQ